MGDRSFFQQLKKGPVPQESKMKILIGTRNPGKIEGAKEAFEKYYEEVEVEGIPVESEVPEEPVNDEIYLGARNRVKNLVAYSKENNINADFFVAVESGITNRLGKWCIIQIAVIQDKSGYESFGTGPAFPVPDRYVDEIINTDLGKLMDKIFKEKALRNSVGGIAFLTNNVLTRIDMTKEAFIMALTEHINNEIWK